MSDYAEKTSAGCFIVRFRSKPLPVASRFARYANRVARYKNRVVSIRIQKTQNGV